MSKAQKTMVRSYLIIGLIFALAAPGCRSDTRAQDAGAPPADLLPYKTLPQKEGLLYTFFNHRAEMQTVEDPADVPQSAQAAVKVTDPRHPLDGDFILVADLRSHPSSVRITTNSSWLDQMMPKSSQLKDAPTKAPPAKTGKPAREKPAHHAQVARHKKPRQKQKSGPVQLRPPSLKGLPSVSELANQPKIILYSTSWCPSCRAARQYLQTRGVRFRELDVEQDPQALEQYQEVQKRYHLRPGVIPVIVINGRPYQGFSKAQIEAALASSR